MLDRLKYGPTIEEMHVMVPLTPDERKEMRVHAAQQGVSLKEWHRQAILEKLVKEVND